MSTTWPTKVTFKEVFERKDSFATTLLLAAADLLEEGFFDWDPVTILMELRSDFGVEIWPGNFDKLMAARVIITTDLFYRSAPDFIHFSNVLFGDLVNDTWDLAEVDEMSWAIAEVTGLLNPPEGEDPFDEEVLAYIESQLTREGFVQPPDVLRSVLPELQLEYGLDTFSDDPGMFQGLQQRADERREDVDQEVRERFMLLERQIASLPLNRGQLPDVQEKSTSGTAGQLLKSLLNA